MEKSDKTETPKFLKITSIDEVHAIMVILRGNAGKNDGDYRSTHLGITLEYLQRTKREDKKLTLSKLALVLGMAQRQVKENYFDGLLAFHIIELDNKCQEWYWIGLSGIQKKEGEL